MPAFGPQLIGATEKSLGALLRHVLEASDLSEPQWVTLRLASQLEDGGSLAQLVRERAHFADPEAIILSLQGRKLLSAGSLTLEGDALVRQLQDQISTLTAPVWAGLDPADVAAAERVLTAVMTGVQRILAPVTQEP